MLTMTVLCVCILLGTCIVGFAFYMLLTEQQRGQSVTDRVSLQLSKDMNDVDRIGQLNNLLGLNRELVFSSRLVSNATVNSRDLSFCTPLAQQLLDEARASSVDLDRARVQQIETVKNLIKFQTDQYNVNTRSAAHFHLPWWQSYEPQIYEVSIGSIANTTSNVIHNNFFQDLNDNDDQQRFVHPKSGLYLGNINAKLPAPDNDLDFYMASLPAPVEDTVAPARVVNPEVFQKSVDVIKDGKFANFPVHQIPSAIYVAAKMKVASDANKDEVKIASVSACSGASPVPPGPDEFEMLEDKSSKNAWGSGKGWGTNNNQQAQQPQDQPRMR